MSTYQLFAAAATEAESDNLFSALGIDFRLLIVQLISFLILYLLLKKFVFPYLFKTLDERQKVIDNSVKAAKQAEKAAQKSEEATKAEREKAQKEAADIITLAQKESAAMISEAETRADKKAEHLIAQAHARVESDVADAKTALKTEMKQLLVDATEQIIATKLDPKKDAALIESALDSTIKGKKAS